MRLTVLVDNQVYRGEGLMAEHGLCLLVETDGASVLLDSGQSSLCLRNAERLGADVSNVTALVLSHGHYDHGGGIVSLLEATGPRRVIAHPDAFRPRLSRHVGRPERTIGLSTSVEGLSARGADVRLEAGTQEINRGILSINTIPRATDFEQPDDGFLIRMGDEWRPDTFQDEQALVIRGAEGLIILLGCGHVGVVNTLRHAMRVTGDQRIRAVVGGFHLAAASYERIAQTTAALKAMDVRDVVACHCTGFAARISLSAALEDRFTNGAVGLRLTF